MYLCGLWVLGVPEIKYFHEALVSVTDCKPSMLFFRHFLGMFGTDYGALFRHLLMLSGQIRSIDHHVILVLAI